MKTVVAAAVGVVGDALDLPNVLLEKRKAEKTRMRQRDQKKGRHILGQTPESRRHRHCQSRVVQKRQLLVPQEAAT